MTSAILSQFDKSLEAGCICPALNSLTKNRELPQTFWWHINYS